MIFVAECADEWRDK